jgi:hypothetical protein
MPGDLTTREIVVMGFGGVLACFGLYQVFRKGADATPVDKSAASSIKVFKFEFVLPRASLFVFLVGCGLVVTPLLFGGGGGDGKKPANAGTLEELVRTMRDANQTDAARQQAYRELARSGAQAQMVSNDLFSTLQSGDPGAELAAYQILLQLQQENLLQQQQQAALAQWWQMNQLALQQQFQWQQQQQQYVNPAVLFGEDGE